MGCFLFPASGFTTFSDSPIGKKNGEIKLKSDHSGC